VNKLFCDHCGKELPAPLRPEWYRTDLRLPKGNYSGHLCEECASDLRDWFHGDIVPGAGVRVRSTA
jgi:hypothetical protein